MVQPTTDERRKAKAQASDIEMLEFFARPSCKKCYGRGYIGTFVHVNNWSRKDAAKIRRLKEAYPERDYPMLPKVGEPVVCRCVEKAHAKEQRENTIRVIEGV